MRIKITVIHGLGTFEGRISEDLTEQEVDEIDSLCKQANKMTFFKLDQDHGHIYFPSEVISQAIIKLEVVSQTDEILF